MNREYCEDLSLPTNPPPPPPPLHPAPPPPNPPYWCDLGLQRNPPIQLLSDENPAGLTRSPFSKASKTSSNLIGTLKVRFQPPPEPNLKESKEHFKIASQRRDFWRNAQWSLMKCLRTSGWWSQSTLRTTYVAFGCTTRAFVYEPSKFMVWEMSDIEKYVELKALIWYTSLSSTINLRSSIEADGKPNTNQPLLFIGYNGK